MTIKQIRQREHLQGSLTVEAALILPFFFLVCMTMFGFFSVYAAAGEGQIRLLMAAEKQGIISGCSTGISGEIGGTTENVLAGAGQVLSGMASTENLRTVPGIAAAAVTVPVSNENDICLCANIKCRPEVALPQIVSIPLRLVVTVKPWTGKTRQTGGHVHGGGEDMVYVTDNREVYHTHSDCTHLDLEIDTVSRSEATRRVNQYGAHYKACEKCGASVAGTVYISPKGDAYHSTLSCGGLTRSVHLVKKSEIGQLPQCTRCKNRG